MLLVEIGQEARAAEPPEAELHGHVKQFLTSTVPYDGPLFPEGVSGVAVLAGRLRFEGDWGPIRWVAHHELTAATPPSPSPLEQAIGVGVDGAGTLGVTTGVGLAAPQAVDVSWTANGPLAVGGATDRLLLGGRFGPVDVTLGRQPISFGTGRAFTPLDLVNPFTPTTVDTEYKPGVDAVRVDAYPGALRFTVAAAYAGAWDLDGLVLAGTGGATVGVTDLLLFVGEVHDDEVFGVGLDTSAGAFGVHGDAALTVPPDADPLGGPFVRAVVGTEWYPRADLTVSAEVYGQSFGALDPAGRLEILASDRATRGEIWLAGPLYASLGASVRPRPLIGASLAVVVNPLDPSGLVSGGAAFSISDEVELSLGGLIGLGARPDVTSTDEVLSRLLADPTDVAGALGLQSELGLVPATLYVRTAVWF